MTPPQWTHPSQNNEDEAGAIEVPAQKVDGPIFQNFPSPKKPTAAFIVSTTLGVLVLVVLFFASIIFGLSQLDFDSEAGRNDFEFSSPSTTSKTSTSVNTFQEDPVKTVDQIATYFTQEQYDNFISTINSASSLSELEMNLNYAIYNTPAPDLRNDILGFQAMQFYITEETINSESRTRQFKDNYQLAQESSLPKVKQAAKIIMGQYVRYPIQVSGKFGKVVVLGENTRLEPGGGDDQIIGGLTSNAMLLSIDTLARNSSADEIEFAQELFNHEARHAYENWLFYFNSAKYNSFSDKWIATNEKGISSYTNEPYNNQSASYGLEHPVAGFVNQYAMTNVSEDKASLFQYMMSESRRPTLMKWAQSDPILQAKIDLMVEEINLLGIDTNRDLFRV